MDVAALYDREVAYYSGRPVVMVIPLGNSVTELPTDVVVVKTDSGVKTIITAAYTPVTSQTVTDLKVLNKPVGAPVSYQAKFDTADTATFTTPPQFSVGQEVSIGQNTYRAIEITGSVVKFERTVQELLVYIAQGVTEDVMYQWQIETAGVWGNITGATQRTYVPLTGDVSKNLRVIVTYTDGRGEVGQASTTPAVNLQATSFYTISPVYPVIAESTLDVQRTYAPNTLNKLVIEIESI